MNLLVLATLAGTIHGSSAESSEVRLSDGQVTSHSQGLHGYIGFGHEPLPAGGGFSAGMGFYAAVWSLTDQPLADFQIGLPSSWIQPDNSDNKDKPLAPEVRICFPPSPAPNPQSQAPSMFTPQST